MLCGTTEQRAREALHLGPAEGFKFLNQGLRAAVGKAFRPGGGAERVVEAAAKVKPKDLEVPGMDDAAEFGAVQAAFSSFSVSGRTQHGIHRVLSALLHLGNLVWVDPPKAPRERFAATRTGGGSGAGDKDKGPTLSAWSEASMAAAAELLVDAGAELRQEWVGRAAALAADRGLLALQTAALGRRDETLAMASPTLHRPGSDAGVPDGGLEADEGRDLHMIYRAGRLAGRHVDAEEFLGTVAARLGTPPAANQVLSDTAYHCVFM
jgi:hypothetical protein